MWSAIRSPGILQSFVSRSRNGTVGSQAEAPILRVRNTHECDFGKTAEATSTGRAFLVNLTPNSPTSGLPGFGTIPRGVVYQV